MIPQTRIEMTPDNSKISEVAKEPKPKSKTTTVSITGLWDKNLNFLQIKVARRPIEILSKN